jgi:hypothetical protein
MSPYRTARRSKRLVRPRIRPDALWFLLVLMGAGALRLLIALHDVYFAAHGLGG